MKTKNTHTVTYTIEVTHIVKGSDTEAIKRDYLEKITKKLKRKLKFDNIVFKHFKVFEH